MISEYTNWRDPDVEESVNPALLVDDGTIRQQVDDCAALILAYVGGHEGRAIQDCGEDGMTLEQWHARKRGQEDRREELAA